jgi:tetratricopeptide (TPR) repeat protein
MKSAIILSLFVILSATIIIFQNRYSEHQFRILQASVLNSSSNDDISDLENKIVNNQSSISLQKKLGFAYINKCREKTNVDYEEKGLKIFNDILQSDPLDFEALIGKATIQLSQHKFNEAMITGRKAIDANKYNPAGYGILTDAYVETGDYRKAIECADSMVSIRPDLRSYSRISYLREIHGDYNGAIDAMKMAIAAGIEGREETEWTRYQLGLLYEKTGQLRLAENEYRLCMAYRNTFAPPYLGCGRIMQKQKKYQQAESFYKNAASLQPGYQASSHLSKLYSEMNNSELASLEIIKSIAQFQNTGSKSGSQFTGKELAELYLLNNDYMNAYKCASDEYNRRPENIDVNHVLAWASYKSGNNELALFHIVKALRTNSIDAELLLHAGIIHKSLGYTKLGEIEIARAKKINPYVHENFAI